MKTFARLIRRYVLATAAVVLVAAALCLGAVAYIGLHYGNVEQDRTGIETLAGALTQTAGGLLIACDPEDAVNGTCEKFIHRPAAGPSPHARGMAAGVCMGDGAGR